MIIRLTDAFRVPFPPLVGEGDTLFPMLSILHILFVSISYIQPANSSKLSAIIDFPAAFRCCLSSEDTHTTMQAVYAFETGRHKMVRTRVWQLVSPHL